MIAISYRREDSLPIAGRLYDRLQAKFGKDNVFMDFDSIPPGVDFREQIKRTIEQSNLVIALIGPHWLGEQSDSSRRIDDPSDFVRLEITYALKRGIPVIPLLIDNTRMPKPEKLPPDIEALAFRNALPLDTGIDFHNHADRLITGIDRVVGAVLPSVAPHDRALKGASVADEITRSSGTATTSQGQAVAKTIGLRRPALIWSALIAVGASAVLLSWLLSTKSKDAKASKEHATQTLESTTASPVDRRTIPEPKPSPVTTQPESNAATQDTNPAQQPTTESQLIGSWQSSRLYTEYLVDHTFKTIGLYVNGMRWKLDGTILTEWYPELGERSPPWYPGAGELSFKIVAIDRERLVLEAKDGRRFVSYRLQSDSQAEHEALAEKAKSATEAEANGAPPPDALSLGPTMPGELYPQTRMRQMSPDELTDWSADQLQYAINEVYARHGAIFPEKNVQQLFAKMSWYHPNKNLTPSKVDPSLTAFERANIDLLARTRDTVRAGPRQSAVNSWVHVTHQNTDPYVFKKVTSKLVLDGNKFVYTNLGESTVRPGKRPPNAPRGLTRYSSITRYKGDVILNTSDALKIKIRSCDFPTRFPKWAIGAAAAEKSEAAFVGAVWTFRRNGAALVGHGENGWTVFEPIK